MKLKRYLTEAKKITYKKWTHQWMIITIDMGSKGAYINYDGYTKPNGRMVNKEYLVKDMDTATKKVKAYIKKLPYADEKDFKYEEESINEAIRLKRYSPGNYEAQVGNIYIDVWQSENKSYWGAEVTIGKYGDSDYEVQEFHASTKKDLMKDINNYVKRMK